MVEGSRVVSGLAARDLDAKKGSGFRVWVSGFRAEGAASEGRVSIVSTKPNVCVQVPCGVQDKTLNPKP